MGIALVPELTVAALPHGVVLVRPAQDLRRHIHAAQRSSTHGDPGLLRLVETLRESAALRVREDTPLAD